MPNGYRQVLEKKSNEIEKPLDNRHQVWYNNNVRGKRITLWKNGKVGTDPPSPQAQVATFPNENQKKFHKPLDILPEIW